MRGIEQEKHRRIQWDDCPRHPFPNKFPRFLHVFTPCCLPNLNVGLGLVMVIGNNAWGLAELTAVCQAQGSCSGLAVNEQNGHSARCTATSSTCYKNTQTNHVLQINSCTACAAGYVLERKTYSSATCVSSLVLGYSYNDCVVDCPSCADCESDTSWTDVYLYPGYQQKITRTCDCGTCNESTAYRCASGYHQQTTTLSPTCNRGFCTGCVKCPDADGIYTDENLTNIATGSSAVASNARTDCYLLGSTYTGIYIQSIPYYDNTGTFNFGISNCPYVN